MQFRSSRDHDGNRADFVFWVFPIARTPGTEADKICPDKSHRFYAIDIDSLPAEIRAKVRQKYVSGPVAVCNCCGEILE